jgi:hypothetical protein
MPEVLPHHQEAVARGARCLECPLYNCGEGPTKPVIKPNSIITVVGEAPDTAAIETGDVLKGAGVDVVLEELKEGGLSAEHVTFTNAILCRPPGGHINDYVATLKSEHKKLAAKAKAAKQKPPPSVVTPQDACAARLQQDIKDSGSKTVLGLGSEGLKGVAQALKVPFGTSKVPSGVQKVATVKKQHGAPVPLTDGTIITAALHPAFALWSNATYMPVIKADIQRAANIAQRGFVNWTEPEFIIKPSVDTCINVINIMRESGALVTMDIETDGIDVQTARIRCTGLGAVVNGRELIICIPLRHMDGRPWWLPGDESRLIAALRELLENNPLSGHNLLFDTGVCLKRDILRNRGKRWFDCYFDDETEFLTCRGWLKYDSITEKDLLATVAKDNSLEWQHYTDRVDKRRKGFLYTVETNHTRAVITPGHTIWHQPRRRTSAGMQEAVGSWKLTPAQELVLQSPDSSNILRALRPERDSRRHVALEGFSLTEDFMRLMGLAVCDGTVRMRNGEPYRLRISQKLNGRAYALLDECRVRFSLHESRYERTESWRQTQCTETVWEFRHTDDGGKRIAHAFTRWFGRKSVDRRLPSWVFRLPPALRLALYEGLLLGDASEVGTATQFRSYSKNLADDVQALALSLGVPATLHQSGRCQVVNLRVNDDPEVGVVTREVTQAENGVFARTADAEYRVVCFVVPNHTLVTRSKGRPAFLGNTMLAHHDTKQSELPHDLGFVAARNYEAPRWKDDADHKNVEGVDDYWLHLYCCKDVLGEMRLVMPLIQQINEQGTINAFNTDTQLAPIARDMGDLGLSINEERRGKFFNILDKAITAKTAELRAITGNLEYNPNAFKQVSKFLYITKGLSPPYATDGREWEELASEDEELPIDTEDPDAVLEWAATNEVSLLRLLELGVDEHTRQFIETQLSYRGLQKCKATQVGYKWEDQDNGTRKLIDTHRKRGFIHTESYGEGLTGLSIFHPSWKLHVVPTGRWASSPNVQNWSERIVWDIPTYKASVAAGKGSKKMPFDVDGADGIINTRAMVCAPPGYTLVGADYNAIELRIYAIMSGDALLLDAIMTGKDPHSLNYATMMARHPSEVMTWYERVVKLPEAQKKYLRNIAKRFGFLEIYGGQEDTLYKTMAADRNPDGTRSFPDLKPADVKMWHTNFHRAHPECIRWQQAVVRAWATHGFVGTIIDGRRRFFIGGLDPTAMPNMSIQGSAASIANKATIAIARDCPHRGWGPLAGLILQVHDFLGLQVPIQRAQDAAALLNTHMPYQHLGMKFDVEQKMGPSWDVV